jgi:dipeptidyl aminopeptidase/acylaminoacyl peptidase
MTQFKACLGLALITIAPAAGASSTRLEPVAIPQYRDVPHASAYATERTYQAAAADRRFRFERIRYESDGLTVFAYVYGPRASNAKKPIIVFNRGSWIWPSGFAGELLPMAHRLADAGYVVVAPMFRGSGGAAGRDEMGGADLDDLLNLQPVLQRIPGGDPSRVYLYGESRGGMMVYQALRDGFHARAAAVVGAFTDLDGMLSNPRWAAAGAQIWPDLATDRAKIVERRSALRWPTKITVPILIIHGALDEEVPPEQSLGMARALLDAGKTVQLRIVDEEDHTIRGRAADRDAWVADWFSRH